MKRLSSCRCATEQLGFRILQLTAAGLFSLVPSRVIVKTANGLALTGLAHEGSCQN